MFTTMSLIRNCDIFSLFFLQNGQTAQSVAEGASHQDIVDLLKAHAEAQTSEPPSTTDLHWARPMLSIPPNPSSLPTPTSVSKILSAQQHSGKSWNKDMVTPYRTFSVWGRICSVYPGTLGAHIQTSETGASNNVRPHYSSTSLPTCPLGVYGYAASTTQVDRQQKGAGSHWLKGIAIETRLIDRILLRERDENIKGDGYSDELLLLIINLALQAKY